VCYKKHIPLKKSVYI